mgnify:CR=1 FL=1
MLINYRFLLATLMAFALWGHSASHAQQKLQAAQSEIVFVSKQMGVPVEGRFQKFNAKEGQKTLSTEQVLTLYHCNKVQKLQFQKMIK